MNGHPRLPRRRRAARWNRTRRTADRPRRRAGPPCARQRNGRHGELWGPRFRSTLRVRKDVVVSVEPPLPWTPQLARECVGSVRWPSERSRSVEHGVGRLRLDGLSGAGAVGNARCVREPIRRPPRDRRQHRTRCYPRLHARGQRPLAGHGRRLRHSGLCLERRFAICVEHQHEHLIGCVRDGREFRVEQLGCVRDGRELRSHRSGRQRRRRQAVGRIGRARHVAKRSTPSAPASSDRAAAFCLISRCLAPRCRD